MFRFRIKYVLLLTLEVSLSGCMPHAVREAQTVVTDADSLWHNGQMYGIDEGDSVTLAEAYQKLDRAQTIFPDEFAHSCYHYGRLLRKKDNPVEAMQAFLAATHSRTHDYHILGRVYSNMGDICHLAGEFDLAYDMYEKCSEMYLRNGDTLLYYYGHYIMAFEKAELGDKYECLALLEDIERNNNSSDILDLVIMTRAKLSLKNKDYLAAINYAKQLTTIPLALLIQAQAYSYLGNKDSSILYASRVISESKSLYDLNNALYILTNDDEACDKSYVQKKAAERADIQKLLKIQQGKLSQATQLLEQDLHRKPNLQWLYASSATILIIGILALVYFRRRHRQHQLLSQQVEDLENKSQELMQEHTTYKNNLVTQLEQNCRVISESKDFPDNLNWKEFEAMCKMVDTHFDMLASKLRHIGTLNETEIRLCILVFFDLDRNQISDVLPYAKNGVGKLKYRVSQKLGVEGKNLRKTLIHIAINERIDH